MQLEEHRQIVQAQVDEATNVRIINEWEHIEQQMHACMYINDKSDRSHFPGKGMGDREIDNISEILVFLLID